jgi:hypothetical protein
MSPVFENTPPRPLDPKELLEEVGKHEAGVDALTLAKALIARGHHPYAIQRAIQAALDRGDLDLGAKLRLQRPRVAA